jgi:hypothetical protein
VGLAVGEVEWSDSTLVGTLGDCSTDPTRNNTFKSINDIFSWEADYGGKLEVSKVNDPQFSSCFSHGDSLDCTRGIGKHNFLGARSFCSLL